MKKRRLSSEPPNRRRQEEKEEEKEERRNPDYKSARKTTMDLLPRVFSLFSCVILNPYLVINIYATHVYIARRNVAGDTRTVGAHTRQTKPAPSFALPVLISGTITVYIIFTRACGERARVYLVG